MNLAARRADLLQLISVLKAGEAAKKFESDVAAKRDLPTYDG